ncbi:MAG: hypothetical protein M3Z50_01650 [Actinomycetota bacterium]|nr:hypothetical protein [Actinomycetota bacterium]
MRRGPDSAGERIDLNGPWQFLAGDAERTELPDLLPDELPVPGLWEANGFLNLDGAAWYRRTFAVEGATGWWSLEFGAVMDTAEVYLNGKRVGEHDGAYTPFLLDVTDALRPGENVLEVRVFDHLLTSTEHRRRAHGNQGWKNEVFPSPPSLYLTYGGIWQPVHLRRHGPVRIADVHVLSDPDDLRIDVELHNHTTRDLTATVWIELFDRVLDREVTVATGTDAVLSLKIGPVNAPRWTPSDPVLHDLTIAVDVAGEASDTARQRFGLRQFAVDGGRFVLNGEPLFLCAALVQGFRHDTLYAEGNREQIEAEVRAARQTGLNMLRLHIKAFDPTYLDVCDELGMLIHADIPVAEPIAHDELGATGELADACLEAAREQVRRDRNHPSLVMWSLMNELCAENLPARRSPGYEAFTRALYTAVTELDPERPVIENDWEEPDPEYVFCSPVLTAHWYGRLSERYLDQLAAEVGRYSTGRSPMYVSEFGDWGLPFDGVVDTPAGDADWWHGRQLAEAIEELPWEGTVEEFISGTQRYQGVSNRLQSEIIRAQGAAGWCLTELTDVPQEYNGLWSLRGEEKPAALAELTRMCQPVLPVAVRTHWTEVVGTEFALPLRICADTVPPAEVDVIVAMDGVMHHQQTVRLTATGVTDLRAVALRAPDTPGDVQLEIVLTSSADHAPDAKIANSYTLHVLPPPSAPAVGIELIGDAGRHALAALGVRLVTDDPQALLVIDEDALTAETAGLVADALRAGRTVMCLAQPVTAAAHLPVAATAVNIATEWGSTPFLFTTGDPALSAFGPRRVLTTEALSIAPEVVWTQLDGSPWAPRTLVGLFKPYPGALTGTLIGSIPVGAGRLWLCQLPVVSAAERGRRVADSLLAELLTLAAVEPSSN